MPMEPKNWLRVKALLQENDGRMHASDMGRALAMKSSVLIAAVRPGLNSGELTRELDGRLVVYVLGESAAHQLEEGETAAPTDIRWTIWDDGDLVVYGLEQNEDGSHTVPAAVLDAIKRRTAWSPAA